MALTDGRLWRSICELYRLLTETYANGTRELFLQGTHVWYGLLYNVRVCINASNYADMPHRRQQSQLAELSTTAVKTRCRVKPWFHVKIKH